MSNDNNGVIYHHSAIAMGSTNSMSRSIVPPGGPDSEAAELRKKRARVGAGLMLVGVFAVTIGVTASGGSSGNGAFNSPPGVNPPPGSSPTSPPVNGGSTEQSSSLPPQFVKNNGLSGASSSINNGTVDTEEAGWGECCDPLGYTTMPKCEEGLTCVFDGSWSSWCVSCTDDDLFAVQCSLLPGYARSDLEAACADEQPGGCAVGEFAGRDERCQPEDYENGPFESFKKCAEGLICVVDGETWSQCVVCQDPYWSEDCHFWKDPFKTNAMDACGQTECEHKGRAARDERCSNGLDQFTQYPQCAEGLECIIDGQYSQCVSCQSRDYQDDCPYWSDSFAAKVKGRCEGQPECGSTDDRAWPGERCSPGGRNEFFKFPECMDDDEDNTYVCAVIPGVFSQCLRCEDWEDSCIYWTPAFLEAAEAACPNSLGRGCGNGGSPSPGNGTDSGSGGSGGSGSVILADKGEQCSGDNSPYLPEERPPCRSSLTCVSYEEDGQQTAACVSCGSDYEFDCKEYGSDGLKDSAAVVCFRECPPLVQPAGSCSTDEDCNGDLRCASTMYFSMCVDCGDAFAYDCYYWWGDFRDAALELCQRPCEPEVCPQPTTEPTPEPTSDGDAGGVPTSEPTMDPTEEPTPVPTPVPTRPRY